MREGSITLGLLIGLTLGSLALGGGAGWYATKTALKARHAAELDALAQDHQAAQDALQGRVEAQAEELGLCRGKVTQESISAALAPDLADAQARADILRSLPRARLAERLIETGSPRVLLAVDWMARCESLLLVGDVDRLGCGSKGEAVQALQDAMAEQAACPEVAVGPLE